MAVQLGILALLTCFQTAQDPTRMGRFALALDPRVSYASVEKNTAFAKPPITVDLWAKLKSKAGYNILIAYGAKESADHWEIYTSAGEGGLSFYLPGSKPSILETKAIVADDRWHFVSFVYEKTRARLFLDAKLVLDQNLTPGRDQGTPGPLWVGAYPPQSLGCDGFIDDVHIRNGVFIPDGIPQQPATAGEKTVGLWNFDEKREGLYQDSSTLRQDARAQRGPQSPPEFDQESAALFHTADESLRVVRIDRSVNESFIAVRVDSAGRIFLGGREGLFVLEPDDKGGYKPRVELYRFPPHSWIGDIEIRGDDLYVATAAAIYRLPDARRKREGIKPQKIVWGTPVDLHVTYHGLAFGPEGDLYFNSGDPLLNYGDWNRPDHFGHWTIFHGPDGKATPFTGVGAVYRCKPDGSDLQLVATGLRGSDGLCFSETWDLFTNDNDHESIPDRYTPFRILHVTQGIDFGWPRGWAARRSPERADLVDPINEGLGRGVPVGMCYYGDTHLPEAFRGCVLVAQWGHRNVTAYKLIPKGASYTTEERPLLVCEGRARPVGVCVGRGGRVFVTIAYMAQNEGSPTYASELVIVEQQNVRQLAPPWDPARASVDEVASELGSTEWSRRQTAHSELQMRWHANIGRLIHDRIAVLPESSRGRAFAHAAWLGAAFPTPRNDDGTVARNNVTALAREIPDQPVWSEFWSSHVAEASDRLAAVVLGERHFLDRLIYGAVQSRLERSEDRVVRQLAARLLARRASHEQLQELLNSPNAKLRLAGALAVGMRLTVPEPLASLPAEVPLNYTSPNALFTVQYADETVNLRDKGRVGSFTMAEYWKAVPHSDDQERLFRMLMNALDDENEQVRLQAAYYLSLLNDSRSEPAIAKVTGESEMRALGARPAVPMTALWVAGPVTAEAGRVVESSAIDVSAHPGGASWVKRENAEGLYDVEVPSDASSYVYTRLQAQRPRRANLSVVYDRGVTIWQNGRVVYENEVGVIPGFHNRITLPLVSGSNDILIRLRGDEKRLRATLTAQLPEGVSLALPERLGIEGLADRLKTAGVDTKVPDDFLKVDWTEALKKGDADRGRKLFSADGIGCAKCHAILPGDAGAGAPSLADSRGRFTVPHVVESILTPSAQVANEFRGTVLALKDGRVVSGLVTSETAEAVEVLLPDATKTRLALSDVEERQAMVGSPMPSGLVKTPDELADLLAYLLGK